MAERASGQTMRGEGRASALRFAAFVVALLIAFIAAPARAATSEPAATPALTARLVTALDGVAPGAGTLSAALAFDMEPGWKTYWRDPGTVGLPPSVDWSGSVNVAEARIAWPVPTRFRAFGIENYGYSGAVAHPVEVRLIEPGAPTVLAATVDLLVCADVCVPERVSLSLDLPASGAGEAGLLDPDGAATIARWAERVPPGERFGDAFGDGAAPDGLRVAAAHLDADALTLSVALDEPFAAIEAALFPALGAMSFDAPDLRLAPDGASLWARLPVVDQPPEAVTDGTVTVRLAGTADGGTEGERLATLPVALGAVAPEPPAGAVRLAGTDEAGERGEAGGGGLPLMLVLAFLGGLVLNAMPCVLPVLSIKLAGAVAARDRSLAYVRAGFLASAAGVVAFALVLAGALIAARGLGAGVGWGVQFQSPAFLAALLAVLTLFGANMLGLFEVALPDGLQTRLARAGGAGSSAPSLVADFAAGAFAALLATPCSAPFLGTAIAFALAGSNVDVVVVLAALGLGLASPYLLVAARPSLVRLLPRPGAWMGRLRAVLGVMLLGTALWLATVLAGAAGTVVALIAGSVLAVTLLALWLTRGGKMEGKRGGTGRIALAGALAALAVPLIAPPEPSRAAAADPLWQSFDRALIAPTVAAGGVVLVDVTADWCLTCKANKASTLDRERVVTLIDAPNVLAMRADWTRPNDAIRRYLVANGRYGIPFNAVYGPGAPDGIALPELLTPAIVEDAFERASGAASSL